MNSISSVGRWPVRGLESVSYRQRLVIIVCACLAVLSVGSQLAAQSQQPNIVFIFTDDHAVQAIGAYGSRINETPNIDRIAREGSVFLNSFCANSLCGPSRACIQTGKHSHLNGFRRNGDRFDSSQTTFPKLLQQAGYQTAVIGKWHLETDPVGYDYWEVLPGQGSYYNPDLIQMDGTRKRYEGYCTDIVTDLALNWLQQQRDTSKPFMLMCQHKAPHRNWAPAARHMGLYTDQDVPEPETLFDDYANRSRLLQENEMSVARHFHWGHDMKFHGKALFPSYFVDDLPNGEYARMTPQQKQEWDAHYEPENREFIQQMRSEQLSDEDVVRWKYQRYIKDYLRCIAAVDESVGRVLDYLDESGLAENTIVIYASDQGFYLGEHGWYDKRWMYEESLKMPFVIRWPGVVSAGIRSETIIQNIDYAPTFLEAAGVAVPAEMQGRSLVPVLRNECRPTADWRDAIYYAYYENAAVHNVPAHDGVRTDRYKLMFFPRTREWQLMDLQEDPHEMRSVHADPAYAEILAGMQKRYRDLRQFYGVNSAVIPATRADEDWWRDRQSAVNAQAREGNVDLAFIGDSITQGWEGAGKEIWQERFAPLKPINLGFSGDRTEHVIWRLTHGNLANIQPKVAVLMIGTNNTGHSMQDPQEVAQGVEQILAILQQRTPETKVLLLGIFPRGKTPYDPMRLNNVAINQWARRLADGQRVHYLDVSSAFLADDGMLSEEIMPDLLHLNTEGYRRWADAIAPKLDELGLKAPE
jgi:arylsulfatase A-like enzyme/lysophospholipase L1-like esterase